MHKNAGCSNVLGDFWVAMINCFEGSASGDNQNFSFLDSWPTGRISGGNVNGVMSSFLRVPFSGSTRLTPARACVQPVPLWPARQGSLC